MRVQQLGSLKVRYSRIGNSLVRYFGFMANVCYLALHILGVATDVQFYSRLWQERHYVCRPIILVWASITYSIYYN
jgi:hypothetical protein